MYCAKFFVVNFLLLVCFLFVIFYQFFLLKIFVTLKLGKFLGISPGGDVTSHCTCIRLKLYYQCIPVVVAPIFVRRVRAEYKNDELVTSSVDVTFFGNRYSYSLHRLRFL